MDGEERGTSFRVINSRAPIRVCDNGGWTDTRSARHG
jgi:D-glycero-alpha-D-manno-heptose-7-phosphate kinase